MSGSHPEISDAELDVLKVLWEHGPATARAVNGHLGRRWAHTTVLTLLQRLEAKGHVKSDKTGVAHVFTAAVTRDRLLRRRLKDLIRDVCDGAATPLVRALVEGHRLRPDEVDDLRRLLDDLEGKVDG